MCPEQFKTANFKTKVGNRKRFLVPKKFRAYYNLSPGLHMIVIDTEIDEVECVVRMSSDGSVRVPAHIWNQLNLNPSDEITVSFYLGEGPFKIPLKEEKEDNSKSSGPYQKG